MWLLFITGMMIVITVFLLAFGFVYRAIRKILLTVGFICLIITIFLIYQVLNPSMLNM